MEMTTTINGERFVDILHDRRKYGDFQWITADWDSPKYHNFKPRSPQDLKNDVLKSRRVQQVIGELSNQDGAKAKEFTKRAHSILQEMGHNQNLPSIRFIGYFLSKLLKKLYSHVFVSTNGMEKIRSSVPHHPVLLMPTHRSYMDFLLMSYISFNFHLPMPVIAAGLDFLGLKAIRRLLRNSGAFYIRRAFGEDKLYWAIFTEYVQNLLRGGDAPVEFYVEGTRSRSAKSLNPKIGLLLAAMELYATAQVSDVTIIPISITYDRTLEESLYAFELLGVPKPKETTSGLFKARKILQENFGNIYLTVGNPISMRDFCDKKIIRSVHNLQPRFKTVLSLSETETCNALANRVIKTHQKYLYLSPFPLMALVLGHDLCARGQGVPFDYLTEQVLWLKELIEKTGAFVVLNDGSSSPWLCQMVELHSNIVQLHPDGLVTHVQEPNTSQSMKQAVAKGLALNEEMIAMALPHMYLYHYGNQALQVLSQVTMLALTIVTMGDIQPTEENVFSRFQVLQSILQKEFVFEQSAHKLDFAFGIRVLRGQMLINVKEGIIQQTKNSTDKLLFLASLLSPFLTAYKILWQYIFTHSEEISDIPISALTRHCQCTIQGDLKSGKIQDFRVLSLDVLSNGVMSLISLGGAVREKRDSKTIIIPKKTELLKLLHQIGSYLGEDEEITSISADTTLIPMAKL